MSAIAGLYCLNHAPVDAQRVERMVDSMAHRGSDSQGIWAEGPVGLGHRMLWTTPESLCEQLPQRYQHWVITADARIDNRDALIAQLGLDRANAAKITDSDIILAAYERWGEDCPEKLIGDFAFVIWDTRQQQLFCARDLMGVKPFYYYHGRDRFVFGSEIKALFEIPEVPREVNETRIAQILSRQFDDRAATMFQQILRFPPAHCLTIAPGVFRLRRYWQFDPEYELKLGSDAEYAEAYREQLTEAVRCRMRTAFPIGSMLSGGMDSSSLACIAREQIGTTNQSTVHTFSTRFDSLPDDRRKHIDEIFYVNKVLEKGGFTPHFIDGDQLSPLGSYHEVFKYVDEAFFAPNLYYNWAWYQRANQNQVRVVLDGIDGDTTVSHGQGYLYELFKRRKYKTFLRQVRAYGKMVDQPLPKLIWHWGLQDLVPGFVWETINKVQEKRQPHWQKMAIDASFAERMKLSSCYLHQLHHGLDEVPVKTARHLHWHGLNGALLQYALEISDQVSSPHQVELRFPFCDRRLMAFCLSLPPEQKFNYGWARLIVRRGLQGILPDEIRSRATKANLGTNTKPNLLTCDQHLLERFMFQENALDGYVDRAALRRTYEQFRQDPLDEPTALTIYNATSMAMWLQQQGQNNVEMAASSR
jgi:asparagine synthase (glutamine-hydrolysing)